LSKYRAAASRVADPQKACSIDDPITIQLIEEPDTHLFVRVTWPAAGPSISARRFGDAAAAIIRLFANASIELARMKAGRR
jgi:hypothetical protein